MAVFHWGHHWEALREIEREVDELLRSVNATFHSFRMARQFPPMNFYETENEYLLTVLLPGVSLEDLELSITGNVLTLKAKRDEISKSQIPEESFRRQERPQGEWERSISLPDRVDEENLSAELANGILKVRLPKAPEARPRHIPVVETDG